MHETYAEGGTGHTTRVYTLADLAEFANRTLAGEDWNWKEICSPENLLDAIKGHYSNP